MYRIIFRNSFSYQMLDRVILYKSIKEIIGNVTRLATKVSLVISDASSPSFPLFFTRQSVLFDFPLI